jgi:acetyl esterase/lipase
VRLGLALDAAHNISKQYRVDPRRVFVAGGSGGGRCASMLGVCFPDAFAGGFYLIGCNFYREMGPEGSPGMHWNPGYQKPGKKYFNLATNRSRHVLLTGDNDTNREQTQVYYNGFVADGFRHVTYIQIKDAGHELPGNEWFEKGLTLLEPQGEQKEEPAKVATAKPAPAPVKAPAAKPAAPEPSEADRLLRAAKLYVTNRRYDGARSRLKKLIETYPTSPAATEARRLLKEIEGK